MFDCQQVNIIKWL